MILASWNINSIRARMAHVLEWLQLHGPDVLCLQETKVSDEEFPHDALAAAGYQVVNVGQKAYNGVATLARHPLSGVAKELPGIDGAQKRIVCAEVLGVRVINVYVPNGEAVGSPKYEFKLSWMSAFAAYLKEQVAAHPRLAVVGDFNVAPEERDVHNPLLWQDHVLFSEPERRAFRELIKLGMVDVFRRFDQPAHSYSWWDYRQGAFRRNQGLRIDHILATPALAERARRCWIDTAPRKLERPSDHAPVVAEFEV